MGKQPRGAPGATLTALPQDVLLHILDLMTPDQIAAYSQLCTSTAASASDPSIWASLARRHLGIAPALSHTLDAKELSRLATSLVSRWWLVTGTFVPGIPVHFRKGFTEVRPRGGIERLLEGDAGNSAYVFGGRHQDAAVPVALPSLSMDFFLDAAGPFPMDGMIIRIVHASEPADTPIPSQTPEESPLTPLSLGAAHLNTDSPAAPDPKTTAPDEARVRIKVNNATVVESFAPDADEFSVLDIAVSPELLLTKPRMNTLVIEYDRSSQAAYWIKQVFVVPRVLPLPPIAKAELRFVARSTTSAPAPEQHEQQHEPTIPQPQQRGRSTERSRESSDHSPPPRRTVGHLPPQATKYGLVEAQGGGRHQKGGRMLKQAKKSKHVFHHNHYRSPRGFAPGSPRSRSGR